jgi:Uma2 family endonuclease
METLAVQPLSTPPSYQWINANWEDYVALRDAPIGERMRLAFDRGRLRIDQGGEGIDHSQCCDLLTIIFALWGMHYPKESFSSLGRCLLENPNQQACSPDLILYVGADLPQERSRDPGWIDLTKWRVPNLVGEISDTTLASDLDEKKHLYAALGIPEYWVIDVRGRRVFAFLSDENGVYQDCTHSVALKGLAIELLEQALQKLGEGTNTSVAAWFAQEIAE